MKSIPDFLMEQGEWLGAGFWESPDAAPMVKLSRAVRRQLEQVPLPAYGKTSLYPVGVTTLWHTRNNVFDFNFSYSLAFDKGCTDKAIQKAASPGDKAQWETVKRRMEDCHLFSGVTSILPKYLVGGNGYTHSIPNFGRVLKEGLNSYRVRIAQRKADAERGNDASRVAFYSALEDVMAGIDRLHRRIVDHIESAPADGSVRKALLAALKRVPFEPAASFYEAVVATNFIFYLDGCDSLGRFDQELGGYYEADLSRGLISHEQAVELIRSVWKNFDDNNGWNVVLGGTGRDGAPSYNKLTLVCLEAARGIRRPNLALRVRRDMPDEFFEAALDTIRSGCGLPALYNEELYLKGLRSNHLNVHYRDLHEYAFGGCTETMIHGCSNVGSLDAGINIPGVLVETMERSLAQSATFDELMTAFKRDLAAAIEELTAQVNLDQQNKSLYRPQPVRSLLMDDCIEAGIEYNAGGARYNWSVVNVGGLANVADSLMAVRKLVYDQKRVTSDDYLTALRNDFRASPELLRRIRGCPRYGNDQEEVDVLAGDVFGFVADEFHRHACWRGGRFISGCLMFATYVGEGQKVTATPDGRKAKEPIADSIGPYQGRDRKGPTAMMKSVSRLDHQRGIGSLVLNMRLARGFFEGASNRDAVKKMIRTFFDLGGMQIQITVVDQQVLRDAIQNPEKFENLIVRIGGYSEYFNRLSPELKQSILERTEHSP